ncbi:GNAT family N-acetyltransferase [Kribbella italica]|uniref:GNAT superfamily N-acetyltransferase n=1 Tax=Kribbella italica TaxID=1540520 RepID=A0A7W9J2H3_9ACTN|nr:GNAT superfamily N-acetyltransferase [Kribbella italica]
MLEIRPATRQDVERLLDVAASPARRAHLESRWVEQEQDDAVFLLAHDEGGIVGQTSLLRTSKYAEVAAAHDVAEINGLHAFVQGAGVGSALIAASEELARAWRRDAIGLGVGLENPGAARLYARLGYQPTQFRVIDEWTEVDADGTVLVTHRDPCDYLLKPLPR